MIEGFGSKVAKISVHQFFKDPKEDERQIEKEDFIPRRTGKRNRFEISLKPYF
jgi:hypothetical protein